MTDKDRPDLTTEPPDLTDVDTQSTTSLPKEKKKSHFRQLLDGGGIIFGYEFMGTCFLTIFYRLFLLLSYSYDGVDLDYEPLDFQRVGFILCYWILLQLSMTVSGAHFNPAVTLAAFFRKESLFTRSMLSFYMVAQFAGSFTGALIALIITKTGGDLFIENGGGGSSTDDSKYWF
mmetsp:Transcript_41916/g.30179  ORF Transcript_41916/g.30179 Transcript_41916/m.30179 type:complete len:175 (-) Transcript_41916:501-1025(-)